MCGISGIYSYAGARPDVAGFVARSTARMASRGPDGDGTWRSPDGAVALGHRRLAILDPSPAGAQPMASEDGRFVAVFNGEVYNYRDLWQRWGDGSRTLRSGTDTEVLLRLYARRGPEALRSLRGMYAVSIWDAERRELFMARDPFGMKPLYYADDGRAVRFSSQVRALLAGGGADVAPDPAGHAGFFVWGFVPEPYTMFRGVRSLPAGSWMTVGPDGADGPHRAVTAEGLFRSAGLPDHPEPTDALGPALRDTVRHHLVADVDVGVFLSGGVDSTTVAAAARQSGAPLRSVTLGVAERRGTALDETPLAERVARELGTEHATVWVGQGDFDWARRSILSEMDQPTTDGVNTYLVSGAAASLGLKAVLSGLGGDELYGGYPGFDWIRRLARLGRPLPVPGRVGRGVRRALAPVVGGRVPPKAAGLIEYGTTLADAYLLRRALFMPWELAGLIGPDMAAEGWAELQRTSPLHDVAESVRPDLRLPALEVSWYLRGQLLRDTDWTSMAHSVEVRLPLLDVDFLRAVAPTLRPDPQKVALANAPLRPVPREALAQDKIGFTVPVQHWTRGLAGQDRGLRGWARYVYRAYLESTAA